MQNLCMKLAAIEDCKRHDINALLFSQQSSSEEETADTDLPVMSGRVCSRQRKRLSLHLYSLILTERGFRFRPNRVFCFWVSRLLGFKTVKTCRQSRGHSQRFVLQFCTDISFVVGDLAIYGAVRGWYGWVFSDSSVQMRFQFMNYGQIRGLLHEVVEICSFLVATIRTLCGFSFVSSGFTLVPANEILFWRCELCFLCDKCQDKHMTRTKNCNHAKVVVGCLLLSCLIHRSSGHNEEEIAGKWASNGVTGTCIHTS